MKETILIKLGELVLKGLNRSTFEAVLLKNIRRRMTGLGDFEIRSAQSTIYIIPQDEYADMDEAQERIGRIFGIVAYSRACVVEKDLHTICWAAADYLRPQLEEISTFKVETKRSDKTFPYDSPAISREVGAYLLQQYPHLSVNVHEPDLIVRVEVRDFGAYVHGAPIPGAGGIPVGTGGKAAILISGGLDSPVAAWRMARRGVELTAIHFASPPYTSELAEEKVIRLLQKVGQWAGRIEMYTVHFAHLQEELLKKCPEDLFTILMRRFMMRCAQAIARQNDCDALITGESLGQVASQTIKAIACTDAAAGMPVFRPLIGTDKAEIVAEAHRIGTYDISIEPFEDCCTVFTPRHPRTRPTHAHLEEAEQALDIDGLVEECLRGTTHRRITFRGVQEVPAGQGKKDR